LHVGLVVLVKRMSVLINFLLQNTKLVSVLGKICPNFAGHVWQDWHKSRTLVSVCNLHFVPGLKVRFLVAKVKKIGSQRYKVWEYALLFFARGQLGYWYKEG
jgi:hypothetical protein